MFQRALLCFFVFLAANFFTSTAIAAEPDTWVYELNTFTPAEGKWEQLQKHVEERIKFFEKNGAMSVGAWMPLEGEEKKIIFLLGYQNMNAKANADISFSDWNRGPGKRAVDPKAKKPTEEEIAKRQAVLEAATGKGVIEKAESHVLTATDFSPTLDIADKGPRVFELRTYTATPGNLPNLLARFRDHTVKLFEKHGMTNIGYWVPAGPEPEKEVTLIYLLAHKDRDAAKASFAAFGKDPAWQEARKASEVKGGGPLTIKGGVQSLFLKPVEFSKLK